MKNDTQVKHQDHTNDKETNKKPNAVDSDNRQGIRRSWQWTSTELKNALDTWEVMTNEVHGPSPDEKMLLDMQKLLSDLKIKLDTLSK